MKKKFGKQNPAAGGLSNPSHQRLDDTHDENNTLQSDCMKTKMQKNVKSVVSILGNSTFTKNMRENDIRRELFLLETEDLFEEKSLKSQMTILARKGDKNLQEWYYQMGIKNILPDSWEKFKKQVIDFCTGETLVNFKRYKDERWYDFIKRLKDFCVMKFIPEEEALSFLRTCKTPDNIQILLYSLNVDINIILKRIEEFDLSRSYQNINNRLDKNRNSNNMKKSSIDKRKIKCFKCGEIGHIAPECKKNKITYFTDKNENKDVDQDYIFINNKKVLAYFDSCSSSNFINAGLLKYLKNLNFKSYNQTFQVADGRTFVSKRFIDLEVQKDDAKIIDRFFIIENKNSLEVILCKRLIEKLQQQNNFPIICSINTKDKGPISWSRPIRSYADKKDFDILLKNLEERGIIEESTSKWLNPVVLTRKANGELRFTGDFRRLNDLVDLDQFEIPRIQELISTLRNKRYFTLIDLKDGFFQIPIKKEDKEKTAFFDGTRLMQFRKMPQGYKNSPAIFQRAINHILKDLIYKICVAYIDDILIFGETLEELAQNTKKVEEKLKKYNMTENKTKRVSNATEIDFLGYTISFNTLKPKLNRSQGIQDFPKPTTRRKLQRFIGMCNYDRFFVPNVTDLFKPLYNLLKKEKKFAWSEEADEAFKKIKEKWLESLELMIPDLEGEFTLETDASDVGLGAVLLQDKKAIAYASRSLSTTEKNYSITEKELLAAIYGMEKFQYYLIGKEFTLVTDHKALLEIKRKKDFGSHRIQRWFNRIERFNFNVLHKSGNDLVGPDTLSRDLNINEENENMNLKIKKMKEKNFIKENFIERQNNKFKHETRNSSYISKPINYTSRNKDRKKCFETKITKPSIKKNCKGLAKKSNKISNLLSVEPNQDLNKISYLSPFISRSSKSSIQKHTDNLHKVYISLPSKNVDDHLDEEGKIIDIIFSLHFDLNHRKCIHDELRKHGLEIGKNKLRKILLKCRICARRDLKYQKSCKFIETTFPGERVGIDLMEIRKKKKIIVAIDYFSRMIWVKEISNKMKNTILNFIKDLYSKFKFKKIITDNGKEFDNNELKAWVKEVGVEHAYSIPYYHQSNGRVERVNRTIRTAINKTGGSLRKNLQKIAENYNSSYHRGIGMPPLDALNENRWNEVIKNTQKYSNEFQSKNKKIDPFKLNETVLIKNEVKKNKNDLEFKDSGKISEVLGKDTYKILTKSGKVIIRHSSQLRSFEEGDVVVSNHLTNQN